MSDDLISRKALFNELFVRNGKVCPNHDIDNFPINFNVKDIKQAIRNAPTAYDADKVVEQLEENAKYFQGEANELAQKGDWGTATDLQGRAKAYRDAAEIVKSGGVSND